MARWKAMTVAALGVAMLAGAALAASNADIVKDRQESMKAQAADVKAVGDYAKGKGDKDAALKAANDLAAHAAKNMTLFPKGTSSAELAGKSNAKPAIWTENAKFQAIFAVQKDKAAKLADVIKTGAPADVGKASADLGKTACVACHGSYRETVN